MLDGCLDKPREADDVNEDVLAKPLAATELEA
jgi:hypothetical protein